MQTDPIQPPAPAVSEPTVPAPITLELGDYAHLGEQFVNIADALKSGDKQRAHALLKKLSQAMDKPVDDEPSEAQIEKDKADRALKTQNDSAAAARDYRQRIFSRPLPTKPEIPEAVNYDAFFAKS